MLKADGNSIIKESLYSNLIKDFVHFKFNDGITFEGRMDIHNNFMIESDYYKFPNGFNYCGAFENGFYHGYGRLYSKNEKYDGKWYNGLKHGNGKITDKYENIYDGNWDMDKKQGKFIIHFSTGDTLHISFDNDLPVGEGELHLKNLW